MPNLPTTGRDADLVQAVTTHYAAWVEASALWGKRGDAEEDRALALAMLEAILMLEPGATFSPMQWYLTSQWGTDRQRLGKVLPFFCGASGVLQMLFVDEAGMVLPLSLVRSVVDNDPVPVSHLGRSFTKDDVRVLFMRPCH